MPYIADPTIIARVAEYLESNVDKTYIDINQMADELQQKYKEYARRKQSAFRASVTKAYSMVLQRMDDQESSEDQFVLSDVSDAAGAEEHEHKFLNNLMNKQLTDLYTTSSAKKHDGNELIDISSDDSENELIHPKKKNGTSNKDCLLPNKNTNSKEATVHDRRANQHLSDVTEENQKRKRKHSNVEFLSSTTVKPVLKKRRMMRVLQKTVCTFKDLGGIDKTLEEICKLILHIRHPEIYKAVGISPPRGFLLHGPPGCGKTLLASAIAGELDVPLLKVAAPELVAGVSGESEQRIRELFNQAMGAEPCVLFIDEIDAITPNRQNVQKEMERRIVAQLLSCLDELNESGCMVLVVGASNRPDSIDPALRRAGRFDREISLGIPDIHSRVQILKKLSSKLKLSENFDFEMIASYTPGFVGADLLSLTREAAMVAINRLFQEVSYILTEVQPEIAKEDSLVEISNKNDSETAIGDTSIITKNIQSQSTSQITENSVVVIDDIDDSTKSAEKNSSSVDQPINENVKETTEEVKVIETVKEVTPTEKLLTWLHDKFVFSENQLNDLYVTMGDFEKALKNVQPSAKREGFATVPDITWNDIGSLKDIREELQMAIVAPVRHAKQFEALGITVPAGVFLCGPPGCGKTLLAKAIANEAGINFISVKGPELLNMYLGESERAVRVCFERARNSSPCVIFFDELDALCPKRSDSREGSASRVVNQMLTEMDGIGGRKGVFLLAASNRPDIIDPAVLRPGRLDKILYVGLPTAIDRVDILRAITKNGTSPKLASDVNLDDIGKSPQCKGYTGADLAALVREASIIALKEYMEPENDPEKSIMVTNGHFQKAIPRIRPSVSDEDQKYYEKLRKIYSSAPQDAEIEEMEYI